MNYRVFHSAMKNGTGGVGFMAHKSLWKSIYGWKVALNRFILFQLRSRHGPISFLNIYDPGQSEPMQGKVDFQFT